MRKALAVVTVAVVAMGIYSLIRDRESLEIKREMLRLVNDLDLTPPQRGRVRLLVEAEHVAAFRRSMDISRSRGDRFDAKLYQEEMFTRLIAHIRDDDPLLAERLSEQQKYHALVVREQ